MPVTALDAATDVLQRARNLLTLDTPGVDTGIRKDLRRAALAMGMAAVDTYMHWAIRKVSLATPLPKELHKVDVPFGDLLTIADASVEARKNGRKNRPQVRARYVLNEKLLAMTFQGPKNIERGLQMLGTDRKPWKQLGAVIQPPMRAEELKTRLGQLSHRRNEIVHEGDLKRQARPQKLQHEAVTPAQVKADLDWIESFITALGTLPKPEQV
ncbi:hypothetical protein [Streptomyces spectabilis]|uniref:RiboL-PSP-HEPN domain-containing protein n=1 Tax=Streptomyces spectabilis TaxID=68270 RepID=A0A7W8B6B3_STRST|nr:hypothetical protein [Streptomyces spectabilis]MBB5109642.1 hypothetical protein [Streptomyces spectabilis]GGV54899.1 hypothetical protein GCM10010245_86850 [Streptomyces spectabilis]